MRAYISLPITGTDDYRERAFDAELNIARQFELKSCFNPCHCWRPLSWQIKFIWLKLTGATDREFWAHYIADDVRQLFYCDTIFLCLGWQDSEGCNIEYYIAFHTGKRIFLENKEGGWHAI